MTDVEESSDTQTAEEAEAAREAALKKAQAGGQTTYKSVIFNLYPSPSFLHYHTVFYTGGSRATVLAEHTLFRESRRGECRKKGE